MAGGVDGHERPAGKSEAEQPVTDAGNDGMGQPGRIGIHVGQFGQVRGAINWEVVPE
jgi:hypothetical protein